MSNIEFGREGLPPVFETMRITTESLIEDNSASKKAIEKYYAAKEARALTALEICSDARVEGQAFLGEPILTVNSITAGGRKKHLTHAFNHEGVENVVIASHFDGTTVAPGVIPTGCGGLGAKQDLEKHRAHIGPDLHDYLARRAESDDPVDHAVKSASRASRLTEKPILGAAVDHRTGTLYPIVVYLEGGKKFIGACSIDHFIHYSPQKIYQEGTIPTIPDSDLPETFQKLMRKNRREVARLARDKQFSERQRVQNPHVTIVTTSTIPASVRLQSVSGKPNTSFEVHVGYHKENGVVDSLDRPHLRDVVSQATYPLLNSLSAKQASDAFGRMHTLLVETPRLEWSAEIAERIMQTEIGARWAEDGRNQILIAAIKLGTYESVEALVR